MFSTFIILMFQIALCCNLAPPDKIRVAKTIIKYCIAAIFVRVHVFELFLTFIILIFQVALCCNLANFYSFFHDISKNIYAFVFTFYLCHAKRSKNWLSYSTKLIEKSIYIEHYRTLSNIIKQLVGYAKYVSQTDILYPDATITKLCT